jgi:hypothetical protein
VTRDGPAVTIDFYDCGSYIVNPTQCLEADDASLPKQDDALQNRKRSGHRYYIVPGWMTPALAA